MPPRSKPPLICIPDTNTLIFLAKIEILGRGAHLWLWDEFEVKVGDMIPHEARYLGQIKGKLNRSAIQLSEDELIRRENIFLGRLNLPVDPAMEDLGERKNCQVSLQLIIQKRAGQVIFLTDELRIVKKTGFLGKVFDAYPIGNIWNSLDFILYLYLRYQRFSYEIAKVKIIDVNALIGGNAQEKITRLNEYMQRFEAINSARHQLPDLWV
jgi:hypothetical protein